MFNLHDDEDRYSVVMKLNRKYKKFKKDDVVNVVPSSEGGFRVSNTQKRIPSAALDNINREENPEYFL